MRCIAFLGMLLPAATAFAGPAFDFDGRTLSITTTRYVVTWRDGACVGLTTLLPTKAVISDPAGPMTNELLPSGVCSLHGHEKAAREQHHPWAFRDLKARYPGQHPPGPDTAVTCEDIPGGKRLTYVGLVDEASATLIQELTVEPGTGDLVVRQRAASTNPGVVGISVPLLNLDPDIELAVPYFGGQRWGRRFLEGRAMGIAYSQFWSASLVIGELPRGGTFMVWAQDEHMRPKWLYARQQGDAQGLSFEALPEAPYDCRTEAKVFAWRLNTFAGNWLQPAKRYKDWMVATWKIVPRSTRPSKWVDDIAIVWPKWISPDLMDRMSQVFPPKNTLMMQWGWLPGFNRRVPEYIPKAKGFADQVKLAHERGYRVGGYHSQGLIDIKTHPTMVADTGVGYQLREPWQKTKMPEEQPDKWLWYIHPGGARWRDFYADKMKWVHETHGLDYLYQDVSGCGIGSSGLIEGLGYHEAMVACETAIRAKVPEAAVGGEFWTEVNVCREDFGVAGLLAWKAGGPWDGAKNHAELISLPDQPHPLLGYLFNDFCIRWPHNVPIRNTRLFHMAENINEVTGAVAVFTTDPDDTLSEARVILERARLWTDGFRWHYPEHWEDGVVAYLRNPEGRVVEYVREGGSTWCYAQEPKGDRLVYGRTTGVDHVARSQPVQIDGWACYNETGPIGLHPESWYCVFPGEPAELAVSVTALPADAQVVDTRITDQYVMVALDGKGTGELHWRCRRQPDTVLIGDRAMSVTTTSAVVELPTTLLVTFTDPLRPQPKERLELDKWEHRIQSAGLFVKPAKPLGVGNREIQGVKHWGPHIMPPAGGPGTEHAISALVTLPDKPDLSLHFFGGQSGKIGDGVHFVVRVNGREVWRHYRKTGPHWEELSVPLADYAGQTVVVTLGLDAGPAGFHLSCDNTWWGDVELTEVANNASIDVHGWAGPGTTVKLNGRAVPVATDGLFLEQLPPSREGKITIEAERDGVRKTLSRAFRLKYAAN